MSPKVKTASSKAPLSDFIYPYPPLQQGKLLKRYKRFLADIELASGETIVAHCPNTGPMTGINQVGSPVWVSESNNPQRKLKYTWEAIQVASHNGPTWVGTNTALPNRVIKALLEQQGLPELGPYETVRSEVKYGHKSRVDFLLQGTEDDRPIYVEVKNTTWTQGDLALFPDTVTTRGQKHLEELMAIVPESRAVMLYFINRSDCEAFAPGDSADARYGTLLREAVDRGVEVLPCRFEVTRLGVRYVGLVPCQLDTNR